MTAEAAPQIALPWASVRLIDPDAQHPGCNRCGGKPLLEFNADYAVNGVSMPEDDDEEPEVKTMENKVTMYACQEHAGELAFAAAYTVTAGPTGAV